MIMRTVGNLFNVFQLSNFSFCSDFAKVLKFAASAQTQTNFVLEM